MISGHAQNGKDTVARMLREQMELEEKSVLITHYADLLKYICRTFFHWNGQKDAIGRSILQRVGTDIVRRKQPDYWVDFLLSVFSLFPNSWDYVLVPDARFPNEIEKLRANGYDVTHLHVVRPGFASPLSPEQQNHRSETALDGMQPDRQIVNGGTLDDLRETVKNYWKENGYEA